MEELEKVIELYEKKLLSESEALELIKMIMEE